MALHQQGRLAGSGSGGSRTPAASAQRCNVSCRAAARLSGVSTSSTASSSSSEVPGAAPPAGAAEAARRLLERRVQPAGAAAAAAIGAAPRPGAPPGAFARWLTRRIGACESWQELQRVWHDYYADTNAVHVTAAASRLARLAAGAGGAGGAAAYAPARRRPRGGDAGPGAAASYDEDGGEWPECLAEAGGGAGACDRPELAKFATSLLCCAADRLPELDARGVANVLHAHAALQRAAPHSTRAAAGALGALAVAAAALAGRMRPQEVSNTLWAAASLRLDGRLPARWFEEFEAATAAAAARMAPREAAGALWAAARLRRVPGDAWLSALLGAPRLAAAGPREVSTLLWALSALAALEAAAAGAGGDAHHAAAAAEPPLVRRLDPAALERLVSRLAEVLPYAGAADVTQAWLALARLGSPPLPRLRAALLARTVALLPAARPQAAACVLHSLARLRLDPGPAWWGAAAPRLAAAIRVMEPQGVAMAAW
ncbi:MAG: hypothetical protein J3K34DRAFT_459023, partial [Monoraphidium minutum]